MEAQQVTKLLARQTYVLWVVIALLALNFVVLIGTRIHADGNAVQTIKLAEPIEVKFAGHIANGQPLKIDIEHWSDKALVIKDGK